MKKKRKILIVDDTEINVELLGDILREYRYDIVTASDGMEALAMVDIHKPDLILLDVSMPRMDGLEVCERLKKNPLTACIPIVMVTALQDLAIKMKALDAGAEDFLSKPFNKVELRARVQSLLHQTELYEILQQRDEELRQVTESLSRLKHSLVHQVYSRLSVISSAVDDAFAVSGESEGMEKNLDTVEQEVEALGNTVSTMLFSPSPFLAAHKFHREEFSFRDMLREQIHNFRKLLKPREKLEEQIPPALPLLLADKELLNLVVTNFLHNAFVHSKKNEREIKVSAMLDLKGGIQVTVVDNGAGISVEEKESLFEKIEYVGKIPVRHDIRGGLALSKRIIEMHNGKIWVESSYGKGAAFSFSIPLK
ncbi:MAG: response regulator [Ignavibacteriales bacterium]|nr:response regulator [Ignavibacteriales bacterium]